MTMSHSFRSKNTYQFTIIFSILKYFLNMFDNLFISPMLLQNILFVVKLKKVKGNDFEKSP